LQGVSGAELLQRDFEHEREDESTSSGTCGGESQGVLMEEKSEGRKQATGKADTVCQSSTFDEPFGKEIEG
jgi:hypothetical protein